MNKIDKAIEHFSYGITHDIFSEPVRTYAELAIDALREKAEREKEARMNEIDKTIQLISDMKLSFSQKYIQEAFDVSIKALREQAERSKGCSFCDEESYEHDYMNGLQSIDGTKYLVLETSEWNDYYDCYNDVRIPVTFCPMCGKRLEVEHI